MRRPLVLVVVWLAVVGTGCVEDGRSAGAEGTVLVAAASSLTDAFTAIEAAYEDAEPGVDVVLNLAASSTLREQILQGAPVDVFASADLLHMRQIVGDDFDVFATNSLAIAVPRGNPAGISSLADFARDDLLLGLCADGAPCGYLARAALQFAGVEASIDTTEPNVRALLTKISSGELDGGIVYRTDVAASERVDGIEIPGEHDVRTSYPIAAMSGAPPAATRFVEFVLSERGQSILAEYGFGSP